jgi:hypothetical protein
MKKPHLCHICGTVDPTRFYGKMKSECYDCYSERKRISRMQIHEFDREIEAQQKKKQKQRKKHSPFCVLCSDDNPAHFTLGIKSLCSLCLVKHVT